jgi:DNA-directed RNA polymerase specialized sigma24 family protein
MKIPNEFRQAIERAYTNAGALNQLFIEHKSFLTRLVHHALRYNHWAVISDEDDLFQEACIWLVNSLWEWDEGKKTDLTEYVVYNIGVRLQNQIIKEQRQKRRPKEPTISIYQSHANKNDNYALPLCERIDGGLPTPEDILIIKRAYQRIEDELPLMARELLESLLLESGNISAASRRVLNGRRIRRVNGVTEDAFRQSIRRDILKQLVTVFEEEHIF